MGQVRLQLSSICSYLILSGLGEEASIAPLLKVLLLQAVEGECEGGGKEGLRLLAKKEIVSEMVKPGMQQMLDVSVVVSVGVVPVAAGTRLSGMQVNDKNLHTFTHNIYCNLHMHTKHTYIHNTLTPYNAYISYMHAYGIRL